MAPTATPTPTPRAGPAIVERVEVLAEGLEAPWAIDLAPDGRLFVTERPGRIRVIKDGVLDPTPWATLAVRAAPDQESGLLGLAIDPDFAKNGYLYVYYTYDAGGGRRQNRLERMREVNGRGERDKVLLDGIAGGTAHDGGRLKFGPDGKLYLTVGDAGNEALAQNLTSPNGKILRLERDGTHPPDDPSLNSFAWSYGPSPSAGSGVGRVRPAVRDRARTERESGAPAAVLSRRGQSHRAWSELRLADGLGHQRRSALPRSGP